MFKDLRVSITKMVTLKKRAYAVKTADHIRNIELEREIKKVDTSPISCVANYLLGEDSALKRMRVKDLIAWGYVQKPKIDDVITKVADKAICTLMGYKVGANIRCIKRNDYQRDVRRIVSHDASGFVVAVLANGDIISHGQKRMTPTQLVDDEWIVDA